MATDSRARQPSSGQLAGRTANVRGQIRDADYYGSAGKAIGLPASTERSQQLRSILRGTEQSLRGVESSVSGRTQGSLMSEAQRQRMVNLERAPISETFREQQGALSDEESLRQALLAEAGQRAGLAFESDRTRLGSLQDQFGSKLTSEDEGSRRVLEDMMQSRQLDFNREELAQQAQLAAEQRAFDERMAEADRRAAAQQAAAYQPNWDAMFSSGGGGGQSSGGGLLPSQAALSRNLSRQAEIRNTPAKKVNPLAQYGSAIGQYGPMALIGKGWAW